MASAGKTKGVPFGARAARWLDDANRSGASCKRLHHPLRRFALQLIVALMVVVVSMGASLVVPVFAAEDSLLLSGIDELASAVSELVDTEPEPLEQPELIDDALVRVGEVSKTPLKVITSAIIGAVVPWAFENAWYLGVFLLGAAALVLIVRWEPDEGDFGPKGFASDEDEQTG